MDGDIGNTGEFNEWLERSLHQNLGAIASREYYRTRGTTGRFNPYSVSVEGEVVEYPVYTTAGWSKYDGQIDDVVTESTVDVEAVIEEDILVETAAEIEYRTRGNPEQVEVTENMWNGDVYTMVDTRLDTPRIRAGKSDYFSHISTVKPLSREMYEALYKAGVRPTADVATVRQAVEEAQLQYRTTHMRSMEAAASGKTPLQQLIGVSALVVADTGEGYHTLVLQRGDGVTVNPRQYGMVGGLFDPTSESVTDYLLREFVEEMYNAPEGTDPFTIAPGKRLSKALNGSGAHLDYLTTAIDAERTNLHIRLVLLIDDPDIGQHLADNHNTNFETSRPLFVSLSDEEALAEIARIDRIAPTSAPCLFGGLAKVDDKYGVENALEFEVIRD